MILLAHLCEAGYPDRRLMWRWIDRMRRKEPAPLAGTPEIRRLKTYSAESGYVYEYYYEGYRVADRRGRVGTEYVFSTSADRKQWTPRTVFLDDGMLGRWERDHERDLNGTERYAVVKLALFRQFDEGNDPGDVRRDVVVPQLMLEELLEDLGID